MNTKQLAHPSKYSDILKKGIITEKVLEDNIEEEEEQIPQEEFQIHGYDTWEFIYFEDLVVLRNIFAKVYLELYSGDEKYIFSIPFFQRFCYFIWETSSKKIVLSDHEVSSENSYSEYLIKRNNL